MNELDCERTGQKAEIVLTFGFADFHVVENPETDHQTLVLHV